VGIWLFKKPNLQLGAPLEISPWVVDWVFGFLLSNKPWFRVFENLTCNQGMSWGPVSSTCENGYIYIFFYFF